jgi:mannose-1-phosphate guanylyltransferase/mannose-6-phosphate isomerase
VLDNGLKVEVGKETFIPARDDVFLIKRGRKHRLSSIGGMARILEVSFGEFDEEDITRYDK